MKDIIIESHPAFILLCLALAGGYAFLLYTKANHPWTKTLNKVLFGLRAVLVFLIVFLLLSPVIKQVLNTYEKPVFVVLQDNSVSVRETTDSVFRKNLTAKTLSLQNTLSDKGYEAVVQDLSGSTNLPITFTGAASDLNGGLRKIAYQYEGQAIGGVLLISDGIYNTGLSPLYAAYNFPVHTLGVGDSTQRQDIVLKNLVYNKIAYQGNKFPLRAEVLVKGYAHENISISLMQGGKVIERQIKSPGNEQLMVADFTPTATEQGIQRYDVLVEIKPGESNVRNNRSTAFIEVVEGKKKILMVAAAPHPDIKTLRAVVEKNPNYDFILHIPGVQETETKFLQPENCDLVIFHQVPDKRGRARDLFQRFTASKTSVFLIVSQQSDLNAVGQQNIPLKFEQAPRQFDDVTPVINPSFTSFSFSPEASAMFATFPPVWVPFSKLQIPASATTLLFQRVGSLATDKPLLWLDAQDERKVAVMLADGVWQWRLQEFSKSENTETFDEVFGKLIQYLSTVDDKSKFRSYPIAQQFSDTEAVVFESQVYNDIYEPVYGNTISLELTDEAGKKHRYSYATSPGNARYQIGGLAEGVYKYRSATEINGKKEEVRGQFLVSAQQAELQNLTADFDLLRKLSSATGGKFYKATELDKLENELAMAEARATIRSEERYDALLNLKWVFFVVLALVTVEWFLRKFFGSY